MKQKWKDGRKLLQPAKAASLIAAISLMSPDNVWVVVCSLHYVRSWPNSQPEGWDTEHMSSSSGLDGQLCHSVSTQCSALVRSRAEEGGKIEGWISNKKGKELRMSIIFPRKYLANVNITFVASVISVWYMQAVKKQNVLIFNYWGNSVSAEMSRYKPMRNAGADADIRRLE